MKAARHTARSKARRAAGPPVAAAHLPADAELHRIAERVLKLSDADETEVDIAVNADALTRFANNTIHQNVAEQALGISVPTVERRWRYARSWLLRELKRNIQGR